MDNVLPFPADLVTGHDRRRLMTAADGSPLDLEFRHDAAHGFSVLVLRCGQFDPCYRLKKTGEGWEAIDLAPGAGEAVAFEARRPDDLFRLIALSR